MSVVAVVKPKGIFSRQLTLKDILTQELAYGIMDEHYRLTPDECGDYTVIYERDYPARGIEVHFDEKNVSFKLSLPNCTREIELFYMIVARTCKLLNTRVFYRDDEMAELSRVEQFIQADIDASRNALKSTENMVGSDEYQDVMIFCVMNPISIGPKELEQIGGEPDKLGEFLNEKQQIDAYYAVPYIYKKNDGTIFGIYSILAGVTSIIPTEPNKPVSMNNEIKVDNWYVRLGIHEENGNSSDFTVRYEDFTGFLKQSEYYDANHIIIKLSGDEIEELARLHGAEI